MKTIVITGAASGLGRLVANNIAKEGHKLILCDRNANELENTKKEVEANCEAETVVVDLSSMKDINKLVDVLKTKGPIDGLLCNAGITSYPGITEDGLDCVFEINYLSNFVLVLKLLDSLADDGRVLMVSSDMHQGLFAPLTYKPALEVAKPDEEFAKHPDRYNYSKLYMLYFTYTLTRVLKAKGSKKVINAFNPGLMHTTNLMPDKSGFTPEFLANIEKIGMLGNLDINGGVVADLMTKDEYNKESGLYYDRNLGPIKSSDLSYVEEYQKELWELSFKLTDIPEIPFQ